MNRPSVLVCDDEPNLRELIRVSLGPGYAVHEASDGEEALALVRSLAPDLLVLDLMMPRLNGLDVLARLKADPALERTRVLVVTAQPARCAYQAEEVRRGEAARLVVVLERAAEEVRVDRVGRDACVRSQAVGGQPVVEEADETVFWIEMLSEADVLSSVATREVLAEANELLAIFAASQRTARRTT